MAHIFIGDQESKVISLAVAGAEYDEFKQLIARATNTWDTMPAWVRTISDGLNDVPSTDTPTKY